MKIAKLKSSRNGLKRAKTEKSIHNKRFFAKTIVYAVVITWGFAF